MLQAIDADTHLFESTQVWDFLDEEMYPRRPIIVSGPQDTVYRRSGFWLIDGNIFPKSAGKGGFLLGTAETAATAVFWSGYRDIVAFSLLILVLIVRPSGLLGAAHGGNSSRRGPE